MHDKDETAAERRARITADIMAQTGIDEALIQRLVHRFYGRVRLDPLIGPNFNARVADWPAHLEKLCAFWSSVVLMSGRYRGQPMQAHLPLPVSGAHFDRWLALFEETAAEVCPPAAAAYFVERARRIADSLELGIAAQEGRFAAPRHTRPVAVGAGRADQ
jgi:hemoglobin